MKIAIVYSSNTGNTKIIAEAIKEELSNHGVSRVWYFGILMFCMRFVAPVAIFLIFLSGLGLF